MPLRSGIIINLLFSALAFAGAALPTGHAPATWGMTVAEIRKQVEIVRAIPGEGFGYAEHLEEDPEVYIRNTAQHERVEYYFYEGRLYKIFIVYDRIFFHTRFYQKLAEEVRTQFGDPKDTYQENFFGLSIQHTLWEDSESILDLRKGAGFIYQVRIDKEAAARKKKTLRRKKSI